MAANVGLSKLHMSVLQTVQRQRKALTFQVLMTLGMRLLSMQDIS